MCGIVAATSQSNVISILTEGLKHLESSVDEYSKTSDMWHHYLFEMLNCEHLSEQYVFDQHVKNGERLSELTGKAVLPELKKREVTSDSVLRVGFVSADYQEHSIVSFMLPFLRNLDSVNWHVTLYSKAEKFDSYSAELKALASSWVDVSGCSPEEMVKKVRANEEDLVVDLMGCTSQPVLRELSMRMAPVQVAYLGYPFSTGLREVDYRIVDELTDPEGEEYDLVCTEKLCRMSRSFLCFESLANLHAA